MDLKKIFTLKNIIFLVILFLFLLLLRWNSFEMPFERDEGEYAYSAWILRQGIMPYENSFLQKPPMIIYTYFLAQLMGGNSLWAPRLLAFISVFLTALILGFVVFKKYNSNLGWMVSFLSVLTLSFPHFTALAANTEIFMILFLVASFGLYFYYRNKASFLIWFVSGIFSSLSILYKPIAFFPLFFLHLFWTYEIFKSKAGLKVVFRTFFGFLLGFLSSTFFVLLLFLISGKIIYLLESVWQFNLYYSQVWNSYGLSGFYLQMGKLVRVWWILFVFLLLFLFSKNKDKRLIFGLLLFSLVATSRTTIGHYYLILMPFLSLAVSFALWDFYLLIRRSIKLSFWYIFLALLFFLIYPLRMQIGLTPDELGIWIYGLENPFNESKLVAQKVVENSNYSDKIFVAGSEPQIYFYSQRLSPTRFIITYPLNIYSPKREIYQTEVVKDLSRNKPRIIVYSNKEASGLWEKDSPKIFLDYIKDLISKDYYLVGAVFWGNSGPVWVDKVAEDQLKQASLLLYRLKDE